MLSWAHNSLPQAANASKRLESYKILKGLLYRTGQLHVSRFVKNIKPPSCEHLTTLDFHVVEHVPITHCTISLISMKTPWNCSSFSICWWSIWGFASLNPMVHTGMDYMKLIALIDKPYIAFNTRGALQTPYERFSKNFTPLFEDG